MKSVNEQMMSKRFLTVFEITEYVRTLQPRKYVNIYYRVLVVVENLLHKNTSNINNIHSLYMNLL